MGGALAGIEVGAAGLLVAAVIFIVSNIVEWDSELVDVKIAVPFDLEVACGSWEEPKPETTGVESLLGGPKKKAPLPLSCKRVHGMLSHASPETFRLKMACTIPGFNIERSKFGTPVIRAGENELVREGATLANKEGPRLR